MRRGVVVTGEGAHVDHARAEDEMTRLEKNGGVPGGYGWMIHLLPATMTEINQRDTFSLAVGLRRNVDATKDQLDALVSVAAELERRGAWPAGDLFDDL